MTTILVADDEANIRDLVQYALERAGHRMVTAKDGAEAVAKAGFVRTAKRVLDACFDDGVALMARRRAQPQARRRRGTSF